MKLKTENGFISIEEGLELNFEIGGVLLLQNFKVLNELSHDIILVKDFCKRTNVQISFRDLTISFAGNNHMLLNKNLIVSVEREYKLKSNITTQIKVELQGNGKILKSMEGLHFSSMLLLKGKNKIDILTTRRKLNLRKGENIAILQLNCIFV